MSCPPFLISTITNQDCVTSALVGSGSLTYRLVNSRFARKHRFKRITIAPRMMTPFDALISGFVREVAVMVLDMNVS